MNIIIIGATSGIGKALYEKYAADGNHNLSAKLKSNRQNGQPGGHIDVRYNGYYGHMYKEFKTNVGFY